ncbi:MAG: efflux RND transporter periplasmic adaptor subunit [Alphaproteobacteria bacterium]|nr:efflux RND transporter periplasmic adaptor subunit [Alphaproteobacteria bacterium]
MQVVKIQKRKIILNFVIIMLSVATGWYIKAKLTPNAGGMMGMMGNIPHVLVEDVKIVDVSSQKKYIASVEAINSVNLIPQVSGYIDKVLFQEGSVVNEGDILFIIEQDRYIANVDLAKAALSSAQANLVKSERDYKRQKALSTHNYASKSTLDQSESAYLQAKAAVAQAKANLELAQIDMEHTEIKAPFTGTIGKALVTEGNFVSSNSQTLARIVQKSPVRVAFSVPDKDHHLFSGLGINNLRTKVIIPGNNVFDEKVNSYFINNEINTNTATLSVYLEYLNHSKELIPGNYVDVILSSANPQPAVVINPAAVMQDANGAYVYAVDDEGKVKETRVQLDGMFESKQIVLSGLEGNEKIIVSGVQKAKDGSTVRASLVSNDTEEAK